MRITKDQIIQGLTAFIQQEILPKMGEERALQILGTVALNAIATNKKALDGVFGNPMVQALLGDDGSGTYELDGVLDSMQSAIMQYGAFPLTLPAVPFLVPREITLRLTADDVDALKLHMGG